VRTEARNISGGRFRPENCRLIRTLTSGSQGSCSSAVSQGVISVCNRAAAVRFVIVNLFSKSHLDCGGVGSDADELSRCEAGRARRASCVQATARALLCKLPHHGWWTVWLKSRTHLNDRLFRYHLRALHEGSLASSHKYCGCPLLPLSRHRTHADECPLLGVKRTSVIP